MDTLRAAIRRWRRPNPEVERELDLWIHDGLLEESLAQPACDAWERLRRTVRERQSHSHGMWVLEQPHHDPREIPPRRAARRESTRSIPLHGTRVPYHQWRVRDAMWGTMGTTVSALINL